MSSQAVIKNFDFRNRLRDNKSNCMPKIILIGWVWNLPYFDNLLVIMSCQAVIKILTSEIDWGIANQTVCQKSVWMVEFEILLYFDGLYVVMSCQTVIKKFYFINLLVVFQIWAWLVEFKKLFRMVGWLNGRSAENG